MNTEASAEVYAVYLTADAVSGLAGTVVNNVVATDIAQITLHQGEAAIADPARAYPIGSTYSAIST